MGWTDRDTGMTGYTAAGIPPLTARARRQYGKTRRTLNRRGGRGCRQRAEGKSKAADRGGSQGTDNKHERVSPLQIRDSSGSRWLPLLSEGKSRKRQGIKGASSRTFKTHNTSIVFYLLRRYIYTTGRTNMGTYPALCAELFIKLHSPYRTQ